VAKKRDILKHTTQDGVVTGFKYRLCIGRPVFRFKERRYKSTHKVDSFYL